MKRTILGGLAALLLPAALAAQQPAASSKPVTDAAGRMSKHFGQLLTSAADEVPADKLGYKP
ncbi:MAG TPA: hypothetical protein VKA44_00425, partial [Gemmatimonadota bacterium]|nr:hypothetical protein [Gemmatimonadota bacterium]